MMNSKLKTRTLKILLAIGLLLVASPQAWAAVEFIKPNDSAEQIAQLPTYSKGQSSSKSHAPEPSTLALIGSGFLSMLVSFMRRTYHIAKRAVDIIGSVIGLVLCWPIIVITAILIKCISPGPVFFSQVRVGKDGKLFEIYKFRTMKVDAEKETGPIWAVKNDTRLIPMIGNFMRKSRIDEIPQFINVLRGDMSIIGPRPERPMFVEQFTRQIPGYTARLEVKPGITGLAQVRHRYDETLADVRKKIRYDRLYIKNICLWTDALVILRTVRVVLTGTGAK